MSTPTPRDHPAGTTAELRRDIARVTGARVDTVVALDALPTYTVLVALDDDTDVRVKGSTGWTVSARFKGLARYDTAQCVRDGYGFRIAHRPSSTDPGPTTDADRADPLDADADPIDPASTSQHWNEPPPGYTGTAVLPSRDGRHHEACAYRPEHEGTCVIAVATDPWEVWFDAYYRTIGRRITSARLARPMSTDSLAWNTGLTRTRLEAIEAGTERLAPHEALWLAARLDLDLDVLLAP